MTKPLKCPKCQEPKSEDEFYKLSPPHLGRRSICQECDRKRNLANYYRRKDLKQAA